MRRLFAMDAGETETVQPLKPLAGNFNGVSDLEAHLAAAKASNTPTANGAAPSATTTADASNDDDENNSTPVPDSPPSSRFKSSGTKHAR